MYLEQHMLAALVVSLQGHDSTFDFLRKIERAPLPSWENIKSGGYVRQSPLFQAQNMHPLGVRYNSGKAGALQLLGDVCMTPLPLNGDFLEAAGSTEAKPLHPVRPLSKPSIPLSIIVA